MQLVAVVMLLATACTGGGRDGRGASGGSTTGSASVRDAVGSAEPAAPAPPSTAADAGDEPGGCRASWHPSQDGIVVTLTADTSSVVLTTTTEDGDAGPGRALQLLGPADELELTVSTEEDVTAVVVTADDAPCEVSRLR